MTELQKEFELTGRASWIDSDLYPSRKIYTNGYVEWLEKKIINAPDWSNAPEKANFYAEDENGMGHWENSVLDPDDPWADCQDYQENPLPAIKAALEQSQALLDNLIQHVDDLIPDQIETARQFIEINAECHCDCYNGFDCGCAQYNFIRTEGLNALAVKIQNQ